MLGPIAAFVVSLVAVIIESPKRYAIAGLVLSTLTGLGWIAALSFAILKLRC